MDIRGTPLHGFPDQFSHEANDRRLFTLSRICCTVSKFILRFSRITFSTFFKEGGPLLSFVALLDGLLNLIQRSCTYGN